MLAAGRGWDHATWDTGLGYTPAEITAMGSNWHKDPVTGLMTNVFPVDPVSMGMAWDNDTQAYQTPQFFSDRALEATRATTPPTVVYPRCGTPGLAVGTMCDPGYGDVLIPNPPPTKGYVGPGPVNVFPVVPPFDTGPNVNPVPIPNGAGHELALANGGGIDTPIPTPSTAGPSGFGGMAMLALLGVAGALLVMSKESRR